MNSLAGLGRDRPPLSTHVGPRSDTATNPKVDISRRPWMLVRSNGLAGEILVNE